MSRLARPPATIAPACVVSEDARRRQQGVAAGRTDQAGAASSRTASTAIASRMRKRDPVAVHHETLAGVVASDPRVPPGLAPGQLAHCPPTLLISGTRDTGMSSLVHNLALL